MKEQMPQTVPSNDSVEGVSSVEKYIFDKASASPTANEGLTYGDLRLARSMLRDEISKLQKQSSIPTQALDRKIALFKKIEVAEQKLLSKINKEQEARTKYIAHYGTKKQDELSDEGFSAISALEALREATLDEWVEPTSEKIPKNKRTASMDRIDSGSDAYKKALIEEELLNKKEQHESDTKDLSDESSKDIGTRSTQPGYFARLATAFKKSFLDDQAR